MNYLFFDLEFASQLNKKSKICEFGYVLTDEKFEIISRGNFIINPNIANNAWDYYVVKNLLKRSKSEYLKAPLFEAYYNKINNLIEGADYVFGHSLNGDAKALNDELQRYDLQPINYEFYDIKNFFKEYSNIKRDISVGNILSRLKIKGDNKFHDAEVDSYNVMLELKAMLEKLEVTLEEMIILSDVHPDKSYNYKVRSIEKKRQLREKELSRTSDDSNMIKKHRLNHRRFIQYVSNLKKNEFGRLNGKKVSFSFNYEYKHYKQILNLVKLIYDEGGEYEFKASSSDLFVKYDEVLDDGSIKTCSRMKYVKEAINVGKDIEVMEFKDFLNLLDLNEEMLDLMDIPPFEFLKEGTKINERRQKEKNIKDTALCFSLGDALKEKN